MLEIFRPRLGIALGGGAARGFAHLGAIAELERAGISITAVAGTSMGALLGAVWLTSENAVRAGERVQAFTGSVDYQKARFEFLKSVESAQVAGWRSALSRGLKRGVVLAYTMFRESFVPEEAYRHNTEQLVPDVNIEDLRLPFSAMASDLVTGDSVVFRRGSLRAAVMASGAVPGLFPPSDGDGHFLVDGAVTDRVPVRALAGSGVDVVLAVDVAASVRTEEEFTSGHSISSRSHRVTEYQLRCTRLAGADVVVAPDVDLVDPLNFSESESVIEIGRQAMRARLPTLERRLRRAWIRRLLGLGASRRLTKLEAAGVFGPAPVEVGS